MSTEYRLNHLIARLLTLLDSPDRENPQQYLRLLSPASERARVIVSQLYPVRGSETRSKLAQVSATPVLPDSIARQTQILCVYRFFFLFFFRLFLCFQKERSVSFVISRVL